MWTGLQDSFCSLSAPCSVLCLPFALCLKRGLYASSCPSSRSRPLLFCLSVSPKRILCSESWGHVFLHYLIHSQLQVWSQQVLSSLFQVYNVLFYSFTQHEWVFISTLRHQVLFLSPNNLSPFIFSQNI